MEAGADVTKKLLQFEERLVNIRIAICLIASCGFQPAFAQITKEAQAKTQKSLAQEILKKAELAKIVSVESPEIMLFTSLSETRAKAVVTGAQKAFDAAQKVLKFDEKERLWPGKLIVYHLPERRDFTVMKRMLLPESGDKFSKTFLRVRGTEPFIILGTDAGAKQTDAEIIADLGETVAEAMLSHKAGVNPGTFDLPNWIRTGFGKAMLLRAEGNTAKFAAHRNKLKLLFVKAKLPTFKASDAWTGMGTKDSETLTISLVEFFLFGMEPGKFDQFIAAQKPDEQGNLPGIEKALEALELKPDTLDAAWKMWVAKQK